MGNKIEPNLGKVLVQMDEDAGKSAGGILIPASVQTDGVKKGRVIAVGPTRRVDGQLTALELFPGNRVLIDPLGATKLKVNGVEQLLMRCEDILGRIEE